MKVIGITGGIASGKSFVARCFERLGCQRIDADEISHEVLREEEVIAAVRGHWGPTVFNEDGQVDRKRLGQIVFENSALVDTDSNRTGRSTVDSMDQLTKLESILHPRVCVRVIEQIEKLRQQNKKNLVLCPAIVLDAPVMFKTELADRCDEVVFVDSPETIRQQRAAERGWAVDELRRRESRQLSVAEKKRRSTAIINNSGNADETRRQVQNLMSQWSLAELGDTTAELLQ